MGKCSVVFREVRCVIEDELTQVYVHTDAIGDCPLGVQGWHHKTFPPSKNLVEIITSFATDDPILWPQEAPDAK